MALLKIKKGENKNGEYLFYKDKYYKKVPLPSNSEINNAYNIVDEQDAREASRNEVELSCEAQIALDPTLEDTLAISGSTYSIFSVWTSGKEILMAKMNSDGIRDNDIISICMLSKKIEGSPYCFSIPNGNIIILWEMNIMGASLNAYLAENSEIYAKILSSTGEIIKDTFLISRKQIFDIWNTNGAGELIINGTTLEYTDGSNTTPQFSSYNTSRMVIKQRNPVGVALSDNSFVVMWDNYCNLYYPSPDNRCSYIKPDMRRILCYSYFDSNGDIIQKNNQYATPIAKPIINGNGITWQDTWRWEPSITIFANNNIHWCANSVSVESGNRMLNISHGVINVNDNVQQNYIARNTLESYSFHDSYSPSVCALNNDPQRWVATWTTETYDYEDEFRVAPPILNKNIMGDSSAVIRQLMTDIDLTSTTPYINPIMFGASTQTGIQTNVYFKNHQRFSTIAAFSTGGFVIAWQSLNQDGNGWGIYMRIFNHKSYPMTDEIFVTQETINNQYKPSIVVMPDDTFMVMWTSGDMNNISNIKGRAFSILGIALTEEFYVSNMAIDVDKGIMPNSKISSCVPGLNFFVWNT